MFEEYNAHLRAKPAPGTVHTVKLIEVRDHMCGTHPPLPASSVFKVNVGNSCTHIRTDSIGRLIGVVNWSPGCTLEFHLVDESELNSD